jgi:hypothetical protein
VHPGLEKTRASARVFPLPQSTVSTKAVTPFQGDYVELHKLGIQLATQYPTSRPS